MTKTLVPVVRKIETEEDTFVLRAAENENEELLILFVHVISQTDSRYFIHKYTPEGEFAEQTASVDSYSRAHDTMDEQMRMWGFREEHPVLKDIP